MSLLKCRYCGGNIEFMPGTSVSSCWRCRFDQTVPRTISDSNQSLYTEAVELHSEYRFDEAIEVYREIIRRSSREADAYWEVVLCKYGINYERTVQNGSAKYSPVIKRLSDTLIFDDEDYKKVMYLADYTQKSIYRRDALQIFDLQKSMLAQSDRRDPCDVYICYNETTGDSLIANEIQYLIERAGFSTYMPHSADESTMNKEVNNSEIKTFAALKSCKIMVVCASDPEYMSDPLTMNVWKRFTNQIDEGANKRIISVFSSYDSASVPDGLSSNTCINLTSAKANNELSSMIKEMMNDISKAKEAEEDRQKAEEIREAMERQKLIDELQKQADAIDAAPLELTEEEQREFDELEARAREGEAKYQEAREVYDREKAEYDALNGEYLDLKKQIDDSPLHAELEDLQKKIVVRAKSNEENVYFRKKTQEKDIAELEGLFARRDAIQAEMDESNAQLEQKNKTLEQKKKSMTIAQGEAEMIGKAYDKRKAARDSFEIKIKNLRKRSTLVEIERLRYVAGQTLTLGRWPKDKDPIEWKIVDVEKDTLLLYSVNVIDCMKYNETFTNTTWSNCSLRPYLNGEFYENAFDEDEKKKIVVSDVKAEINPLYQIPAGEDTRDRIFIPSIKDMHRFFKDPKDAVCKPTKYAVAKGVEMDEKTGACYYWLRNPGNADCNTARVSGNGVILEHGYFAGGNDVGVRAAMRITLERTEDEQG